MNDVLSMIYIAGMYLSGNFRPVAREILQELKLTNEIETEIIC